jgi:mRNA interferase MazF
MTGCEEGDIVLVRFPFTDLTSIKKRPAVVLSTRAYADRFGDVVLMPLTSQIEQDASLALSQWKASGLVKPTWVKPVIGTLSIRLIERHLGRLMAADEQCIRAGLATLVADRWKG